MFGFFNELDSLFDRMFYGMNYPKKSPFFSDSIKGKEDKDDDGIQSYSYYRADRYENGENTYHRVKETKNGKVLKDITKEVPKSLEGKKEAKGLGCSKKTEECEKKKCESKTSDFLEKRNKSLEHNLRSAENALIEKDKKIEALEAKLSKIAKFLDLD